MKLKSDNPKSREYKTFTCKSCSYKADVFGEKQKDYNGTYETFVCLNCKILTDCETEDVILDEDGPADFFIHFAPTEPKCLCCDKSDLIPWNSNMCLCPKCNEKMELTRLEINVDQVGTVRII
jgi:hypothetical protein